MGGPLAATAIIRFIDLSKNYCKLSAIFLARWCSIWSGKESNLRCFPMGGRFTVCWLRRWPTAPYFQRALKREKPGQVFPARPPKVSTFVFPLYGPGLLWYSLALRRCPGWVSAQPVNDGRTDDHKRVISPVRFMVLFVRTNMASLDCYNRALAQ